MIAPIHWTIDGNPLPVDVEERPWQANMVAPGGYDRFTGYAPILGSWDAGQGSKVVGWHPDGTIFWFGRLSRNPRSKQGVAKLEAQGPKVVLEKAKSRFPYQIRDYGAWAPANGDPYGYSTDDSIQLDGSQKGRIIFRVTNGTDITSGDVNRSVLWVPNNPITRVAGTLRVAFTTSSYEFRIHTAVGPSGSLTQQYSTALTGGFPLDFDISAALAGSDDDLVTLSVTRTGATATTTSKWWLSVRNLRVGCLSNADDTSPSDVAVDMASRYGFDTSLVAGSSTILLPLDWVGSAADLLTYADLWDDWRWLAVAKDLGAARDVVPALDFGPWQKVWDLSTSRNADDDLDDLEICNRVTCTYPTVAGATASVSLDANPDPLAGTPGAGTINEFQVDLQDAQPGDSSATAVCNSMLAQLSVPRLMGRISIVEAEDHSGYTWPHKVQAGALAHLKEWDRKIPPQRITGANYTPYSVDLDITADVSAEGIIASLTAEALRV